MLPPLALYDYRVALLLQVLRCYYSAEVSVGSCRLENRPSKIAIRAFGSSLTT